MDSDRLTPTLPSILERMHNARQAGMHVSMPGRVESYDAARQAAIIKPLLTPGTTVSGVRVPEEIEPISDVPVVHAGGGGYHLSFPIAAGDTVLLVFMDTSVDRWLQIGGLVDPGDDRRNDINDAVAVTGLRDFAHALTVPDDAWSLGKDGGPTIEGDAGVIAIGGRTGAVFTFRGQDVIDALNSFAAGLLACLTAISAATVPPTSPAVVTFAGPGPNSVVQLLLDLQSALTTIAKVQ